MVFGVTYYLKLRNVTNFYKNVNFYEVKSLMSDIQYCPYSLFNPYCLIHEIYNWKIYPYIIPNTVVGDTKYHK